MSTGWKIWFSLLVLGALYGLVLLVDAKEVADTNATLANGAPQQTVVALWQLVDLTAVLVYELIAGVVAVASIGLFLISRDEKAALARAETEGLHVVDLRPAPELQESGKHQA